MISDSKRVYGYGLKLNFLFAYGWRSGLHCRGTLCVLAGAKKSPRKMRKRQGKGSAATSFIQAMPIDFLSPFTSKPIPWSG